MSAVYLQGAVLNSALADNLTDAALAVEQGLTAHSRDFVLHERNLQRNYFAVIEPLSLMKHLHANINTLHNKHAIPFADCLLIIASTGLNIEYFETLTHTQKNFTPSDATSLNHLALTLQEYYNFAAAFCINTACTSAANALLYGARLIEQKQYSHVVVLAFETPSEVAMQGFGTLELTSSSKQYRPFHPQRDGLILGESYAATLLTSHPTSQTIARFLGGFSACDTSSLTGTREDGSHITWVMQQALSDAQCDMQDIDLIKLHGTATHANDLAERNGMQNILEHKQVPALCVMKPWLGHTLGACGLSETLLLIECLKNQHIPVMPDSQNCSVPLIQDPLWPLKKTRVLANFFGFGGNNASLIFDTGESLCK
ncbi:MAG: beta-ketoacyl synthase N-terminal-like domain-containing protein [Pseudomonas sp.]|nr:beta-ketoacyl synthase N-terminal-like domain-containing protein [Pseudomonas sp.]